MVACPNCSMVHPNGTDRCECGAALLAKSAQPPGAPAPRAEGPPLDRSWLPGLLIVAVFAIGLYVFSSDSPSNATAPPDQPHSRQLEQYMRDAFGGSNPTPWMIPVVGFRARAQIATIEVRAGTSTTVAKDLCSAAGGFLFSNENRTGMDSVEIVTPDNILLAWRYGSSRPCKIGPLKR